MKTSSFFSYTGPGRISIARFAPRNTPAGYRIFKALAPGEWFNKVTKARYTELFEGDILARLDPQVTWDRLHELAAGAEPVLLCWERPADLASGKTYCHRRMVAGWFERHLPMIEVPEMTHDQVAQVHGAVSDNPLKLTCITHNIPLVSVGRGYRCPQCGMDKEAQAL